MSSYQAPSLVGTIYISSQCNLYSFETDHGDWVVATSVKLAMSGKFGTRDFRVSRVIKKN